MGEDLPLLSHALAAPQPWMRPYAALADAVLQRMAGATAVQLLNALADAGHLASGEGLIRFVPHDALASGEAYEAFVHRTGRVPTRENLHDLFNGLVWLRYPHTKRHFNALQAGEIARRGVAGSRGALRDALTVFDENGAVLEAPAPLVQALRERDWRSLFVERRALWQHARLTLFGHALLEKLMSPRKAITAHVWVVGEGEGGDDESLAAAMTAGRLIERPFLPLPVLGVPGWWPANAQPSFYDDETVFRPGPPRGAC